MGRLTYSTLIFYHKYGGKTSRRAGFNRENNQPEVNMISKGIGFASMHVFNPINEAKRPRAQAAAGEAGGKTIEPGK